jgi:hypothetical protein
VSVQETKTRKSSENSLESERRMKWKGSKEKKTEVIKSGQKETD